NTTRPSPKREPGHGPENREESGVKGPAAKRASAEVPAALLVPEIAQVPQPLAQDLALACPVAPAHAGIDGIALGLDLHAQGAVVARTAGRCAVEAHRLDDGLRQDARVLRIHAARGLDAAHLGATPAALIAEYAVAVRPALIDAGDHVVPRRDRRGMFCKVPGEQGSRVGRCGALLRHRARGPAAGAVDRADHDQRHADRERPEPAILVSTHGALTHTQA